MNTFLLCSGVHGDSRGLDNLRRWVEARRPDGVLFAGGVLAESRRYEPKITDWGMSRADCIFVERFFETLGELNVFSAVIPGPTDTPLEEFLRLGMHAEVEFPSVRLAHATLVTGNGIAVTGVGGWVSEGAACELDCCSRTLAQYHVRSLADAAAPRKVLLLPRPPVGPAGTFDRSLLAAEMIDSLHPDLCVTGAGHDPAGVCRVAHTLVVNPGCLADGRAAWLDWRRPAAERVELLHAAAADVPGGVA